MENIEIARIFEEVGDLLELQAQNPFRVRAYRNAARTVETLGRSAAALSHDDPDALCKLPGVGKDLAGKITAIVETGELPLLQELKSQLPEGLVEMMHIGGLGPKRAKLLYDRLGVKALDELEAAVAAGKLRSIRGFGEVLERRIVQGIAEHKAQAQRFRLADAEAYLRPLLAYLRGARGLKQLEVAGSYRRRRETVGDVDILAAATRPRALAERFVSYPQVARTLAHGATRCSVVLTAGLRVDFRVVPEVSWGAALH